MDPLISSLVLSFSAPFKNCRDCTLPTELLLKCIYFNVNGHEKTLVEIEPVKSAFFFIVTRLTYHCHSFLSKPISRKSFDFEFLMIQLAISLSFKKDAMFL